MVYVILICCLKDSDAEWNYSTIKIYILKDLDCVHNSMLLDFYIAQNFTHFFPPSESFGSLLKPSH